MIRVVLADDQALVRGGFRMILRAERDIEVVAEAGDGAEAIEAVRATRPVVVLMAVRLPAIASAAAIPSSTGILTSRITRSGVSDSASSIALAPSPASPTTS